MGGETRGTVRLKRQDRSDIQTKKVEAGQEWRGWPINKGQDMRENTG